MTFDLLRRPEGAEFQIAETYAFAGNADQAFEYLDRALKSDLGTIWVRNDPLLASLRADPHFGLLLKQIKLTVS